MHVLICSYEFDLGAEGICTGRLVRALLDAGCEITVLTSPGARRTFVHERLRYHLLTPGPLRPAKLFFLLAPLLGHIPTRFGYIWSRRVARHRLERRPDLVYGRAQPFQSVAGAHGLAVRHGLPLWTHLSDPMPSPFWEPGGLEHKRALQGICRLARESQALTFTTEEGLAFQETLIGSLGGKAFVLNHVAPEPAFLPSRNAEEGAVFAYFGLFYGPRTATALLEGFRLHLSNRPKDRLLFVGTDPKTVLPEAERLEIEGRVTVMGRVDNVRQVMAGVDVLVATDSFSGSPVFLTTKLVEYLMVNRPVVLISPSRSPGSKLLAAFRGTATLVFSEQAADVRAGLSDSITCNPDDSVYEKRFAEMKAFSAKSVAKRFLDEVWARAPRP